MVYACQLDLAIAINEFLPAQAVFIGGIFFMSMIEENKNEIPAAFRERLQALLPSGRIADCWQSFAAVHPTTFRANRLKADVHALCAELLAEGFSPTALRWKTDAFAVPAEQRRALTECAAYG